MPHLLVDTAGAAVAQPPSHHCAPPRAVFCAQRQASPAYVPRPGTTSIFSPNPTVCKRFYGEYFVGESAGAAPMNWRWHTRHVEAAWWPNQT